MARERTQPVERRVRHPAGTAGVEARRRRADWRTNARTQVNWGLAYIKSSYGTPCGAWDHEMSVDPHWY